MTRKLFDAANGDLLVTMGNVAFLRADGMAGRALIKALCGDDPARLRRFDVRFTSPVYPGEALHVEIWRLAPGDAAFRLVASDRKVVVEDCGRVEYA